MPFLLGNFTFYSLAKNHTNQPSKMVTSKWDPIGCFVARRKQFNKKSRNMFLNVSYFVVI